MDIMYRQDKTCFPHTEWIIGKYVYRGRHYAFEAVCSAKPCPQAINGGQVVKLFVSSIEKRKLILSYDYEHQLGDKTMYARGMVKELVSNLTTYVTTQSTNNKNSVCI